MSTTQEAKRVTISTPSTGNVTEGLLMWPRYGKKTCRLRVFAPSKKKIEKGCYLTVEWQDAHRLRALIGTVRQIHDSWPHKILRKTTVYDLTINTGS